MLQHVIERQILNLILGGVDLLIAVLEVTLDDESARIASLGSAGMVAAGVAALGKHEGDVAVGGDNLLDEGGQAGVDVVGDYAHALGLSRRQRLLDVARHILLQHSLDVAAGALVRLEDSLAAEQAALLGAVPVELDGVGRRAMRDALVLEQHAQRLEDGDGAAAIVVGARRRQDRRQKQIDAVLVRADHHRLVARARDLRDHRRLAPWVHEWLHCRAVLERS